MSVQSSLIPNENIYKNITIILLSLFAIFWLFTILEISTLDYNVFFLSLSIVTGIYYLKEKFFWYQFIKKDENGKLIKPWWLEWTAEMFPIIFTLFLVRGFIVEPFKVPTGSMIPTIKIGNVLLISKLSYDLKFPIIDKIIYSRNEINRGDIVVFRYPKNPSTYYIKRFIGLPGDVINYNFETKELTINKKIIPTTHNQYLNLEGKNIEVKEENLFNIKHLIWLDTNIKYLVSPDNVDANPLCNYSGKEMLCVIPKDAYFAMGDNRDNSLDSRYWGFVPKKNVIGKAFLNFGNYKNLGIMN